jgi:hypothetical protein
MTVNTGCTLIGLAMACSLIGCMVHVLGEVDVEAFCLLGVVIISSAEK